MPMLPQDEASNFERLDAAMMPLVEAARGRPVVLSDGDRTLSPIDTSRLFLERAGMDSQHIQERFKREGYCFSAFRYHAEAHLRLDPLTFERVSAAVAEEAPLHPGAADFLHRAAEEAAVFVISAGIPRIWRGLLDREGLKHIGVIGGIDPRLPFVFGRWEKGHVCRLFRSAATEVMALGDSDVDTEMMLEADHAVVVLNHRMSADLLPHLAGHRSLHHIAPGGQLAPEIPRLTFESAHRLVCRGPASAAGGATCP
ncbi:haloacid dehalogenase-like hydrolase [Archangium gephyra]|uniref:HAD family hydrolase n=1 Tax=Archangium gephyra TaxID=48 RepID=UPI003B7B5358